MENGPELGFGRWGLGGWRVGAEDEPADHMVTPRLVVDHESRLRLSAKANGL